MKFKHHLQFWIAIGIILTLVFGLTYNELEKAFFFVSFLMPVAIAFIMFGLILFFMMLPQEFNAASRVLIINLALQFYVLHKMNLRTQNKD